MNRDEPLMVTPPSLPKGGGAIRSLGEGLGQVGAHGAASLALPLPISPGRGFAPTLALNYSSSVGNSPFGIGWNKTVNAINRQTSRGVPVYTDDDLFVGPEDDLWMPERDANSGAVIGTRVTHYRGLLVGDYFVVRFWPRVEQSFARVEHWTNDADPAGFWLVHSADGSLHLYGKTNASRQVDPDRPAHVGAWLLDESLNCRGEHIVYEYKPDDQAPDEQQPRDYRAQRYLSRVSYGNVGASDQLYSWRTEGWQGVQWLFHLVFDYGERPDTLEAIPTFAPAGSWNGRSDAFSDFDFGFELSTQRLCRQVLMFHHFPDLGPEPVLVKRLLLEYRETGLGYNHLCAAHSQAFGHGDRAESRPPLEFTYNPFEPLLEPHRYQSFDTMPGLNDGQRYQLVDLYGEGLPGILYRDDKAWYYREPLRAEPPATADDVAFSEWRELAQIPVADSTRAMRQWLGDVTGDGSLDWVMAQPGWAGFFSCQPDRSWSGFATLQAFPQEFFNPKGQWADLIGDGLMDLAMIGPRSVRLYASQRARGFGPGIDVARQTEEDALPLLSNSNGELVAFSDVMGSGKQHLIRIRHDRLECWPNLGRGRFGQRFVFSALDFTYDEFDASHVLLADLDGSGAADLIYLRPEGALIYLNRCGNGFTSQPIILAWPEGVRYDRFCQVSAADLQGLGCSSLVLTVPHMTPRHWRYDFVSAKPYLLCATNNNMGAAAAITYRSSAQEWLDEKQQLLNTHRKPECRLPFPVPLVSTQTHYDEITGNQLSRNFVYREGYYDPQGRQFRGFGLLLSTDCETFSDAPESEGFSAPLLSKTWFHTGREIQYQSDEYFKGDHDAHHLGAHLLSCYEEQGNVDQIVEPSAAELPTMSVALAGQVLRVETFALDDACSVPYTVEQHRYLVRKYNRPTGERFAPHPTMLALRVESITYHYEQQVEDPRCQHFLGVQWDRFGCQTKALTVCYARRMNAMDDPACQRPPDEISAQKRWWCDAHDPQQQVYYVNETRANFIHLTDPQGWHLGLPYQQRDNTWALDKGAGLTPQTISYETCDDSLLNPKAGRVLAGQSIQRYRDPSALARYQPLPDGSASFQALPDFQEVAELDDPALLAFELLKNEQGELPFDLEQKLRAVGYHPMPWLLESDGRTPGTLWSVRRGFNTYAGPEGFYNVVTVRQALSQGVTHLGFDPFWCLNTRIQLPDGCETNVDRIDYRQLLPVRVIDPNFNVQEARYGAFGQVYASSFQGSQLGVPVGFAPLAEYLRPGNDSPGNAIEAPHSALQNAATAYFEDPFSWMGRVPEADLQDRSWLQECVRQGDLLPSGHIRASARRLSVLEASPPTRQRLQALITQAYREPVHAATLQADRYPGDQLQQIRISVACWDGFGRSLQLKQKVEPGHSYHVLEDGALALDEEGNPITVQNVARWRVSERVEYNNKGQSVRIYRPYFADCHRYINDVSFRAFGFCDRQFYDPLGRLTRTVLANEGYMRRHTYFPWYTVDEDENDTEEEIMALRVDVEGDLG
ncbi:hypothetical protein PS664_01432 [Pseudomonas fluorescens]|nr:hypothetical protein PS664_01432 [Pseudomonas fluorescens]